MKILVVDDNVDSAESLALLLSLGGHQTDVAHDGPGAVDAAARFQPDVMLLDICLPRMDGLEVCRLVRQEPWGRNIGMVALTGFGEDKCRHRQRRLRSAYGEADRFRHARQDTRDFFSGG